jgi:hypothetical protein
MWSGAVFDAQMVGVVGLQDEHASAPARTAGAYHLVPDVHQHPQHSRWRVADRAGIVIVVDHAAAAGLLRVEIDAQTHLPASLRPHGG